MTVRELKIALTAACEALDFAKSVKVLNTFKSAGGGQCDAYTVLEQVTTDESLDSDFVLELMDIVWGWCPSHQRIWDETLRR